jgi:DNA-binding PadR family transcriptional regulator
VGRGTYLGELEATVLAALRRHAEANGAALHREIESTTGRDLAVAAIHVTLRRLETKGLVSSRQTDVSPRGGRPRRYYQLTRSGESALEAFNDVWRRLWSRRRRLPSSREA